MPPRTCPHQVAQFFQTSLKWRPLPVSKSVLLASPYAAIPLQQTSAQPAKLQSRSASILSRLSDNKGAYNKRIRKGRGPSSGYGKTSGRGHKGQGQHGHVKPWFQGGQTPLIVKHGRMGFENHTKDVMSELNLNRLQAWIDAGRIDPEKPITPKEIIQSNLIGRPRDGIKLLARGSDELRTPINIVVSRASQSAIKAVERAGGKITTRYYTNSAIRRLLTGESDHTTDPLPAGPEHVDRVLQKFRSGPHKYRLPDPTSRWDIEYYRDPAHRGYLSHQVKPGESPSLFFKVPKELPVQKPIRVRDKTKVDDQILF